MVSYLKTSGFILVALKTTCMVCASLTYGFSVACVQAQAGTAPGSPCVWDRGAHSQLSPLPVWFFPYTLFLDVTFALLALLSSFSTS